MPTAWAYSSRSITRRKYISVRSAATTGCCRSSMTHCISTCGTESGGMDRTCHADGPAGRNPAADRKTSACSAGGKCAAGASRSGEGATRSSRERWFCIRGRKFRLSGRTRMEPGCCCRENGMCRRNSWRFSGLPEALYRKEDGAPPRCKRRGFRA